MRKMFPFSVHSSIWVLKSRLLAFRGSGLTHLSLNTSSGPGSLLFDIAGHKRDVGACPGAQVNKTAFRTVCCIAAWSQARLSFLHCRHAFGLRADVYGNLHFAEENTILYPCGHNVVLYNMEGKVQKLIPGAQIIRYGPAVCCSPCCCCQHDRLGTSAGCITPPLAVWHSIYVC